MARRKRTDFQREADLVRVAEMYKERKLQVEIAKEIGVSQGQISQDLAEVIRRWRAESTDFVDDAKQRELDRIYNLEIEYWNAWGLSLQDATGVAVETKSVSLKVSTEDGAVELPATETKTTKRRTGQSGNPAYLAGVMSCIDRRCKLLGLDAPTKSELTGKDGGPIETVDVAFTDEERASRIVAIFNAARDRRDRQSAENGQDDLATAAGSTD